MSAIQTRIVNTSTQYIPPWIKETKQNVLSLITSNLGSSGKLETYQLNIPKLNHVFPINNAINLLNRIIMAFWVTLWIVEIKVTILLGLVTTSIKNIIISLIVTQLAVPKILRKLVNIRNQMNINMNSILIWMMENACLFSLFILET